MSYIINTHLTFYTHHTHDDVDDFFEIQNAQRISIMS